MTSLRVAFIAGTLGRGGAEQQLVHMAGALIRAGVEVRVHSLTRSEPHEASLRALGIAPVWVGRLQSPAARAGALTAALVAFRPHVVQSAHFYANLYATLAAAPFRAAAIGALRSDLAYEQAGVGRWHGLLLRRPGDLITNSWRARDMAEAAGRDPATVHVVTNVVDIARFRAPAPVRPGLPLGHGPIALHLGSLQSVKRTDRFITALAQARRVRPELRGLIVGDGPERGRLERLAGSLHLTRSELHFAGAQADVVPYLQAANFLALTSDHEGSPNVVLEAQAAGRPVVATPCGDVPRLVDHGRTGLLVPYDSIDGLASAMQLLAGNPDLCEQMGAEAGRRLDGQGHASLATQLMNVYRAIAMRRARLRLATVLS